MVMNTHEQGNFTIVFQLYVTMRRLEMAIWFLFILTMICRILFDLSEFFVLIPGFCLSILYFYFTFFLINRIGVLSLIQKRKNLALTPKKIFASILIGFIYSLAVMGMFLRALNWPGSSVALSLSVFFLVALFITLIQKIKKDGETPFFMELKKRTAILALLVFIFLAIYLLPLEVQDSIFPYIRN